jgi:hypothetical protein
MEIDVTVKDEEQAVLFQGKLNRNEVGFLLQYAINDLIAAGVQFHLDAEGDDDAIRFTRPDGATIN